MENIMVKNKKKKVAKGTSGKKNPGGAEGTFQREKFALDILNARKGLGRSQRDVGEVVKISSAGLTFLERAECVPSAETFARLCKFYKLSPLAYL